MSHKPVKVKYIPVVEPKSRHKDEGPDDPSQQRKTEEEE